jgi:hypothetical protein
MNWQCVICNHYTFAIAFICATPISSLQGETLQNTNHLEEKE